MSVSPLFAAADPTASNERLIPRVSVSQMLLLRKLDLGRFGFPCALSLLLSGSADSRRWSPAPRSCPCSCGPLPLLRWTGRLTHGACDRRPRCCPVLPPCPPAGGFSLLSAWSIQRTPMMSGLPVRSLRARKTHELSIIVGSVSPVPCTILGTSTFNKRLKKIILKGLTHKKTVSNGDLIYKVSQYTYCPVGAKIICRVRMIIFYV